MKHLVIFVKEPLPGRVKSRLARGIGAVGAAWWQRHQTTRLLRRLGPHPRWLTWLAIAPDGACGSRFWPEIGHDCRLPQGPGDLGQRMARVFRSLPPGPALIIGSDIPAIMPRHIAMAFARLGTAEAVLGPAPDGGYWLIGLRRGGAATPAGFLKRVRWSGPHAMADTERSLRPLSIAHTTMLADVDEPADLSPPPPTGI